MRVQNLSKSLLSFAGYEKKLLNNLSFDIEDKGITSILVPKGVGKSLLLRTLAGLDDKDNPMKIDRAIYIPSSPSSFPWLNVEENIKFAVDNLNEEYLKSIIDLVGLEGYKLHTPANKSLGFRFRISLARSIAVNPKIILLDEPFINMNDILKKEIYQVILDVNYKLSIPFLLATSNITEAVLLSEKIHLCSNNQMELIESFVSNYEIRNVESRLSSNTFINLISKVEESINQHSVNKNQIFF